MRSRLATCAVFLTLTLTALLALARDARAQAWHKADGLIIEGKVVTLDNQSSVLGRVLVRGNQIVAVVRASDPWPAGVDASKAFRVAGQYVIYPGMINAHNHTQYNMLPIWSAPKKYTNRYQWTGPDQYKRDINSPKKILTEPKYLDLSVEVGKWAEVKCLAGGETSVQGSPGLSGLSDILARNVENSPLGGPDKIYQHGLAITDGRFMADVETGIKAKIRSGACDAFLIHLAEGIDEASRAEWDVLVKLGLNVRQTVVIHGTAFGAPEFQGMGQAGMSLVWSPLSNLLLYGKTTDIKTARQKGVRLCLGSDWSPSGCKNLLGEIKFAAEVNKAYFGSYLSDEDLVRMVTANPADALGLGSALGRIKAGLRADLVLFRDRSKGPYRTLIEACEKDVMLVVVDGEPILGDSALLDKLRPGEGEKVPGPTGMDKAIVLKRAGVNKGNQTLAEVAQTLQQALLFDPARMRAKFREAQGMSDAQWADFLKKTFPTGLRAIVLDPIFHDGDKAFFDALRGSANAALPFDLEDYWKKQGSGGGGGSTGSPRVLAFLNSQRTTADALVKKVHLPSNAAREIAKHRDGPDGKTGTPDDDPYDSIAELDSVRYVGPSTINKIEQYVLSLNPERELLDFLNSAAATVDVLDLDVGLPRPAAVSICAYRNGPDGKLGTADDNKIDSRAELEGIPNVGPSSIRMIEAYLAF